MVSKKFRNENQIKADKYIFLLLLLSYIIGICIGSYFVFSDSNNAQFTTALITHKSFNIILYFIMALLLKYSGVLSGLLGILPLFLGINNSANYSCTILGDYSEKYKAAFTLLKDTAVIMLLVLYIIVLINQIINKKYFLKKDIKIFCVYLTAVIFVIVMEVVISSFIF